MRQLLPTAIDDVDPLEAYGADRRPQPPGRPWLLANMVASADGATAVDGRSGALGSAGDKAVFRAVRAVADVIVVAAGTMRAENYRPPQSSVEVEKARRERGQAPRPRLAVVTRALHLDPGAAVFSDPTNRPLVFTSTRADPDARRAIEAVAEVVEAGDDTVDLGAMLAWLGDHDAAVALCEGGPSLLGQLVGGGLVDELCLTLAPALVSGDSSRLAHGPSPTAPAAMTLARVLEADSSLFLRYVRAPSM